MKRWQADQLLERLNRVLPLLEELVDAKRDQAEVKLKREAEAKRKAEKPKQ